MFKKGVFKKMKKVYQKRSNLKDLSDLRKMLKKAHFTKEACSNCDSSTIIRSHVFILKKGFSTKCVFKKGAFQEDEKGILKKKQLKRGDLRKMSKKAPFSNKMF